MGLPPSTQAQGFDALYGLELSECTAEAARARVLVRDELRQLGGVVHGGVYGAIADALATRGTAAAVRGEGKLTASLANHTHALHPLAGGTIHATAARRHRGRTTWVWEVELRDDDDRLVATARVTVGVRDPGRTGS